MPGLTREHRDLSAMVCIVRHQVREETRGVRLEALDAAIAFKSPLQFSRQSTATDFQMLESTLFGHGPRIQLRGEISHADGLQPHQADIVDVRHDGCGFAPPPLGGVARHASAGRFWIRKILMRLFVACACSSASVTTKSAFLAGMLVPFCSLGRQSFDRGFALPIGKRIEQAAQPSRFEHRSAAHGFGTLWRAQKQQFLANRAAGDVPRFFES